MNNKQFHAAAALFLDDKRASGCSPATLDNYKTSLDLFAAFAEQHAADHAAPGTLAAWKVNLYHAGKSLPTIKLRLSHLRLFFAYAVAVGMLNSTPCTPEVMRTKKAVNTRPYTHLLDRAAILKILSAPEQAYKNVPCALRARNKAILTLLITAGLRNSEIRALRLRDLDFDNKTVTVERGKGGKFRIVSFPDVARQAVKTYMASPAFPAKHDENTLLFGQTRKTGEWQEISRQGFSEIVRRSVLILTGIDDIRSHALRHAYASMLLAGGVGKAEIQELLGHSCIQTTERYINLLMPEKPAEIANSVFSIDIPENAEQQA